jgi:transcriptional regulator with XRE-family HTH domain
MLLNFKLIGRQVKESRMRLHISQAELAERIDMSVSYISNIENAKKQASLESLVRISNELGTTINELLCGNQIHDSDEYHTDMDLLMSDCSNYEKRIIFELARATKAILRDNACMIEKKEDDL